MRKAWFDEAEPPWIPIERPVVRYSTWQDGWDWLVIAHESGDHCVSVQFHPPSKRLPWSYPSPKPTLEKSLEMPRELEVA